ncbi:hypothetical protein [Rhodococcus sp. W8901]|uniref:hypothetical protein n=1 Tax=Rhodococcus sp. W8901 TaxID=2742603 RepID=UPI00158435DC|nr:hypothetical protein [Rhodococcus sp. W8901]QKT13704.1 hypothetical protein HUN07_25770 [Rhodococcus sp. W8901]
MSMNFMLGFVPNTDLSAFGADAESTTDFDGASRSTAAGPSAAQVGAHVLLVDPDLDLQQLPQLSEPPAGTVLVTLGGTSDVYVVQSFGDDPRLRVLAEREVAEDLGAPIDAEAVFETEDDPEDAHLEFVCRLAGITVEELWNLEWALLASGRGGFFGRLFGR